MEHLCHLQNHLIIGVIIFTNLLYQSMVVLISAVQPSNSCIHIYFFSYFFHFVYYRILNIAPSAIQCDLVFYKFFIIGVILIKIFVRLKNCFALCSEYIGFFFKLYFQSTLFFFISKYFFFTIFLNFTLFSEYVGLSRERERENM